VRSALFLVRKLACFRTTFGSAANPSHTTATAMHFPTNAGLIFLTDELGQIGNLSPLGVLFKKTVQFQGKLFTSTFLQAAVASPILGSDFLKKFKVTVSPEISQIQFACSAAASSAIFLPSAALPAHSIFSTASSGRPSPLLKNFPIPCLMT
jgi:hypothetical protein